MPKRRKTLGQVLISCVVNICLAWTGRHVYSVCKSLLALEEHRNSRCNKKPLITSSVTVRPHSSQLGDILCANTSLHSLNQVAPAIRHIVFSQLGYGKDRILISGTQDTQLVEEHNSNKVHNSCRTLPNYR